MKLLKESLLNWFGYTRRERRASLILMVIILAVFGTRYIIPSGNIPLEELSVNLTDQEEVRQIRTDTVVQQKNAGSKKAVFKRANRIIELNSCDSADLEALPGIGPVLSARIIKYRNLLGGFARAEQLKEVYGLKEETIKSILSRVTADSLLIRKISINSAGFRELARHPYIKKEEIPGILKFRELEGRISGLKVLVENNLISAETAKKIGPYLDFYH